MAMANQNCGSILGGTDFGSAAVANMGFMDSFTAAAIVNLTNPGPSPFDPTYLQWWSTQMVPLEQTAQGLNPALTMITPGGTLLGYVIGPSFARLSVAKQMTVMIHEFNHAAGNHTELNPMDIVQTCGTAVP